VILATGGAGFVGANCILDWLAEHDEVVNLDKLTYAGNLERLGSLPGEVRHVFVQCDVGDRAAQVIAWLLDSEPLLSAKDRADLPFDECEVFA